VTLSLSFWFAVAYIPIITLLMAVWLLLGQVDKSVFIWVLMTSVPAVYTAHARGMKDAR
jgi:hypothetical protein